MSVYPNTLTRILDSQGRKIRVLMRAKEVVRAGRLNEEDLNDLRNFLDVSQKQKESRQ